jgi:alkylation response protein AidB-like acyl-CoA dehydrogenase
MYNLQAFLRGLAAYAKQSGAWADPGVRRELGHYAAELDALWAMLKLSISEAADTGVPGIGASAVKLFYTELNQRIGETGMRILGRGALARDPVAGLPNAKVVYKALNSLSLTIAAGSSQIQRNIIGERILGLPKER